MGIMEFPLFLQVVKWAFLFSLFCNGVASSDLNQKITSALPCFERFAMETFFKEHDGSCDSCLEDYILLKIPFSSDGAVLVLLDLKRRLIGEGSHRRLSSSIKLSIRPNFVADFSAPICEILLIERLPSGVFADPFELEHLLQRGVFKDASVFGDTNLELPSFLSNRSLVEVHLNAAIGLSAEQEIIREFNINIPLHARYPPLEKSGYSNVKFGVPDLFMRCKMQEESPIMTEQTCLITPAASSGSLKSHDIIWSVPTGINAHARTVSAVTFASAILSVIFIVMASLTQTGIKSDARLKQS